MGRRKKRERKQQEVDGFLLWKKTNASHHEGVGLCGEGAEVGAADANAELDGAAGGMRQQRLGHVAHNALGTDVL